MHQVETKALPKIPPNSYKFIFITFKDTQKISDEKEIKQQKSVLNKSVKFDPIGKCVTKIGVKTDQSKEDETHVRENNNGQSLSKNGNFSEKEVTQHELLQNLEAYKEKSKFTVSLVQCKNNTESLNYKSEGQTKNKLLEHLAEDIECTFPQKEDNKEDTLYKGKKQPKENYQLTSTILKLKNRVTNSPLLIEEARYFQEINGDDGIECENINNPDLDCTEVPNKELLKYKKNLHLNEEDVEQENYLPLKKIDKKGDNTSSMQENEASFQKTNEDNIKYTVGNNKEVSKENFQLSSKNVLHNEKDSTEFEEQNEANDLVQNCEDKFASHLAKLSRRKSRESLDLQNLDMLENYALSSKILKKEKNEAAHTKKLLNEEKTNEKFKEHSERKLNVDVTEVPRIRSVESHDCVKNLAVTLKCISEKKNLLSSSLKKKNKSKEEVIKKIVLSEEEGKSRGKSRLQEENEDNSRAPEKNYKRTDENFTELQQTNDDDPEDYPVSYKEDIPVPEDIFSSEFQEQSEAKNLFQKNEEKFDSNLDELPRKKSKQSHDSQHLDMIEENKTKENYALPSNILKKNLDEASDTKKLLSEEETNEKKHNEYNIKNKLATENKLEEGKSREKSKLQEENEANSRAPEKNYKRTDENCTELPQTNDDDPEDYPVSYKEDIPVPEDIFSSEFQEQNEANNLFQKNEEKFDSNLDELPRKKSKQSHDSQHLDMIAENKTKENYALPSNILKKNQDETSDTKKLLSEEETDEKKHNEYNIKNNLASENKLDIHVTDVPKIKSVESHDCVQNLAVTLKCISDRTCTVPSLSEGRNKANEMEYKKILLIEKERKSRLQEENEDNSENISQEDQKRTDEHYSKKIELGEDGREYHHAQQRNSSEICDPLTNCESNNEYLTKNEIILRKTAIEEKKMALNEPESQHKKEIVVVRSKKPSKSYHCVQDEKYNKNKKIKLMETTKTILDKLNAFLNKNETFDNSENLNVSEKVDTSQNMRLFEQDNDEKIIPENIEQYNNEDIVQISKEFLCTEDKNDEHTQLAEIETENLSVTHENLRELNENCHQILQQYETSENEDDVSELIKRKKNNLTMRSEKVRRNVSSESLENSSIQTEHPNQLHEKKVFKTKSKKINIISNELLNSKEQIDQKIINKAEDGGKDDSVKETQSKKRKEKARLTQKRIRDYFTKNRRKSANKQDLTIEEIEKDRSVSSHYSFESHESTSEESLNQSINEQSDDYLKEKLINKITQSIDKVIHENEHLGVSHEVNVNVDVKKINSVESTEEEVVVSYKKCLNKSNNEISDVRKKNKKVGDDSTPSFEQTLKHVEEKAGSDNANDSYFDDNEEEEKNEEQSLEDEEPITKMIKKLDGLKIVIPWSLPTLHQIKVITGFLTNEQKQELTDQGITIKTGKFTKLEDESIKSNWTEFCKQYDLPLEASPLLNFSRLKGIHFPWEERLNFVRFLAHGLSNRTLQSVYKRFQKLNTEMKTGRFTEKEDEIIMKYVRNSSNNDKHYTHLATILNRNRNAVYRRHKILMTEDKVKKIKWNEKQITEFMKHMFKVTNCDCTEHLRERDITTEEWNKMSQKMNIPNQQLRRVWFRKIYPRLFIEKTMNTNEVKRKLIKILLDREEDDWKNIKWNEIAEDFPGLTGQYLYFMFKATVRYYIPKHHHSNLKECLKHLRIRYSGWGKSKREISKLDLDESYLMTEEESDTSI